MKCRNCGQDNPEGARFCAACGAPLLVPWWPGVGSSYQNAWRQLWKNFLELFLILIISFVISLPNAVGEFAGIFTIFTIAYSVLVQGPVEFGVAFAYLKAARDEKPQTKDIFEAFHNYWNVVLASLLVGAIVSIGMVLLIIPGIIFACKLAFTPYLVIDRKMGPVEAVKESWRMTGGHAWTVLLIGLLAIPISIAGLLCLGVGIIVAIMWVALASASLYYAVSRSEASPTSQAAPVALK